MLDFNAENRVVGIEILRLSSRAPGLDPTRLVYETQPPMAYQIAEPPP
jgi:hypothetical protein